MLGGPVAGPLPPGGGVRCAPGGLELAATGCR